MSTLDVFRCSTLEAMDRNIAVQLFGWQRLGDDDRTKPFHRPSKDVPGTIWDDWESKGPHPRLESSDGKHVLYFCNCASRKNSYPSVPCFSTDIAAAWLVLERLLPEWACEITTNHQPGHPVYFIVKLWKRIEIEKEPGMIDAVDANIATAICLAALKTVNE